MVIVAVQVFSIPGMAQAEYRLIKSAINTSGNGKCLQAEFGNIALGTAVVQSDCHGGTNQRFTIQQITFGGQTMISFDRDRTKCVGITNNARANPWTRVQVVECMMSMAVFRSAPGFIWMRR